MDLKARAGTGAPPSSLPKLNGNTNIAQKALIKSISTSNYCILQKGSNTITENDTSL